ncbi:MAG TPA: zinc ribbon domain-containing protein [Anaerolineales bacterium]
MRRWLVAVLVGGMLWLPYAARAQSLITLSTLQVQLWPEYDQPKMLVIYDFRLPVGVKLPVSVSMSIPKEAHLVAVASQAADGSLLNTDYIGPTIDATWQTITIQIQTATTYHLEYYQALTRSGNQRQFTYRWPGNYAVDHLSMSIRVPPETTSIVTDPDMKSTNGADGTSSLTKDFGALPAGQQLPVQVTYTRTTDALSVPQESVQPSKPIGSSTPGRVLLTNYLPYFLGALVVVGMGAAAVYFLQPRRGRAAGRERHRKARVEGPGKTDVYCHQCGARAQTGDQFCRICGTRLRLDE